MVHCTYRAGILPQALPTTNLSNTECLLLAFSYGVCLNVTSEEQLFKSLLCVKVYDASSPQDSALVYGISQAIESGQLEQMAPTGTYRIPLEHLTPQSTAPPSPGPSSAVTQSPAPSTARGLPSAQANSVPPDTSSVVVAAAASQAAAGGSSMVDGSCKEVKPEGLSAADRDTSQDLEVPNDTLLRRQSISQRRRSVEPKALDVEAAINRIPQPSLVGIEDIDAALTAIISALPKQKLSGAEGVTLRDLREMLLKDYRIHLSPDQQKVTKLLAREKLSARTRNAT
jgi:hypothetical protein